MPEGVERELMGVAGVPYRLAEPLSRIANPNGQPVSNFEGNPDGLMGFMRNFRLYARRLIRSLTNPLEVVESWPDCC